MQKLKKQWIATFDGVDYFVWWLEDPLEGLRRLYQRSQVGKAGMPLGLRLLATPQPTLLWLARPHTRPSLLMARPVPTRCAPAGGRRRGHPL